MFCLYIQSIDNRLGVILQNRGHYKYRAVLAFDLDATLFLVDDCKEPKKSDCTMSYGLRVRESICVAEGKLEHDPSKTYDVTCSTQETQLVAIAPNNIKELLFKAMNNNIGIAIITAGSYQEIEIKSFFYQAYGIIDPKFLVFVNNCKDKNKALQEIQGKTGLPHSSIVLVDDSPRICNAAKIKGFGAIQADGCSLALPLPGLDHKKGIGFLSKIEKFIDDLAEPSKVGESDSDPTVMAPASKQSGCCGFVSSLFCSSSNPDVIDTAGLTYGYSRMQ